jgi:hypothetical protein
VLSVPYWLSGGSSSGLLAGAALLNGGCVAAIAWLAHRRGGRPLLLLSLLLVALLTRTIGLDQWVDPWNPSIALFPLLVFLFACWGLADGDDVLIPVLVVAGTFAVQAHVGYAPLLALPFVVAVVSRVLVARGRSASQPEPSSASGDAERSHARTKVTRSLVWGAIAAAVLWLPPLIDQLVHRPGNLQRLASFARSATSEYGLKDGVQFTQYELGPKPSWLFQEHVAGWLGLVDYSAPPVPVIGVLLVAALGVAIWRKDSSGIRLAALSLSLIAASVLAVSRIVEGLFPYVVRWSAAVGLFAVLAVVWIGWRAVQDRVGATARQVVGGVVVAGLVAVSLANVVAAATTPPHDLDKSDLIHEVMPSITAKLDKSRSVAVTTPDPTGGVEALFMLPAVLLQLEREGYDVRTGDERFTNRSLTDDEPQVVSIHHIAPDAPTVPDLAAVPPVAQTPEYLIWVTPR